MMNNLALLIGRKTWNASPAILAGKPAVSFGVGWRNYLDSAGRWKKINCLLNPLLSGFEVTEAPFYFKAPLRSTGYAEFISNNRFDLFPCPGGEKVAITAPEFSQVTRCLDATTTGGGAIAVADVPGELIDLHNNGGFDAVIYRNVFPQWKADLIYYVQHGRAPPSEKTYPVQYGPRPGYSDPV